MKTNVCGKDVITYSRVVGYFGSIDQWNEAKQEEFKDRKTIESSKLSLNDAE